MGKRHLYLMLGFVFFGVGIVGVVLPVLPTTPFMLLALWAFSNSSERFHNWLYTHPKFGPSLQIWSTHGVVPKRAKISALTVMAGSFIFLTMFSEAHWAIIFSASAFMLIGATFLMTRPSQIPVEYDTSTDDVV
ncbi:MAG: YbaN family protein [Alphaproteobacteria bacterium]|nr:YbaN family protein [Alphaproteobacteria bacterium]MBT4086137.1 YbaN family protein [Alphaproteobacteria bacterium]MBT4543754.1 YbaN family protein [Alphaproteobacteria bacterium]MBT7743999.1 YbaN family protein [Alphaproteobacteria bacterium]